jgi:hypothetical protein
LEAVVLSAQSGHTILVVLSEDQHFDQQCCARFWHGPEFFLLRERVDEACESQLAQLLCVIRPCQVLIDVSKLASVFMELLDLLKLSTGRAGSLFWSKANPISSEN